MSSSQRSKSFNHFFDGFINSMTTLKKFIDGYEDALEKRYEVENEQDNKSLQTNTFLKIFSPFERQAGAVVISGHIDYIFKSNFKKLLKSLLNVDDYCDQETRI